MGVNLIFTENSPHYGTKLQIYVEDLIKLSISIIRDDEAFQMITLSKQDAIKLSKELKKQINIISTNQKSM